MMDRDRDAPAPEGGDADSNIRDSGRELVRLAAERTLLSWVRVAIGFIVLGFAVDRFGLLLARRKAGALDALPWSSWVGLLFVAIGVLSSAAAAVRYRQFAQRYPPRAPGARTGLSLAIWLCCLFAVVGSLLDAYLWLAAG